MSNQGAPTIQVGDVIQQAFPDLDGDTMARSVMVVEKINPNVVKDARTGEITSGIPYYIGPSISFSIGKDHKLTGLKVTNVQSNDAFLATDVKFLFRPGPEPEKE